MTQNIERPISTEFLSQDLTTEERFSCYQEELEIAGAIKNLFKVELLGEKRETEAILNSKISEVLNDFAKMTGCRIEGMTVGITHDFSTKNPGEKKYMAKVSMTVDSES